MNLFKFTFVQGQTYIADTQNQISYFKKCKQRRDLNGLQGTVHKVKNNGKLIVVKFDCDEKWGLMPSNLVRVPRPEELSKDGAYAWESSDTSSPEFHSVCSTHL